MFGWTERSAVFSGVTLCDGMRHNSAKSTTYIPNEGVDMHGDADPRAFNSSNCNTMDIIITGDFGFLSVSSCPDPDFHHRIFYRQKTAVVSCCCSHGQNENGVKQKFKSSENFSSFFHKTPTGLKKSLVFFSRH